MAAITAGDAKVRVENDLARVQDALVIAEEAKHKAKAEVASLVVERTSFMLEVEATKDEVSSLHSQLGKDKAAMEEDYEKSLELIFTNGYKCCMFKHNICGDKLKVPNGMLDSSDPLLLEFFANLRCPPVPTATEATTVEVN